jgi:endoglucanase
MSVSKIAVLLPLLAAVACAQSSDSESRADAVGHTLSVAPVLEQGQMSMLQSAEAARSGKSGQGASTDGRNASAAASSNGDSSSQGDSSGSDASSGDSAANGDATASGDSSSTGGEATTTDDSGASTADGGDTGSSADDSSTSGDAGSDGGSGAAASGDVFGMYSLFVESSNNYASQAAAWRTSDPASAAIMDAMAAQPLAVWLGDWTGDVSGTVDSAITEGGSSLRTLVVYDIPNRDCGAWSSGGAADATAYAAFISKVAAGIAGRPVIVVLEPDALPLGTSCLSASEADARYAMMSDAVDALSAAGASVYLDSGDSNWIGAAEMASRLEKAGVAHAAGFSLDVSHTEYEANEMAFAEELRAILGDGAHYVIDTSRSGLGPTDDSEWCNPLGRAVGTLPTTVTGVDGLDAYLWIKPPGESDGSCNGGPTAGTFWASYALELGDLSSSL